MKKLSILLLVILFFLNPALSYADVITTVSVTASVAPHASDFSLSMSSSPTSATTVNQFQKIVYTITYGSNLAYATPMTITASWTQGTIQGQGSPSVDIADYVVGSASNGYNSTAPVVDTTNKTITWTISSIPANTTGQTVNFTLETNASYTGASTVIFPTTAQMTNVGVTVPSQSITMTYQYNANITPSPTLTLTPTISPTPTSAQATTTPGVTSAITTTTPTLSPTPTPTPFIAPSQLVITDVAIETISPTNATIQVRTNIPASSFIEYGTSPRLLNQISQTITGAEQLITLENLQPNTKYYFRVVARSGENQTVTPEIFTFTTAVSPATFQVDKSSLIVTSGSTLLYSSVENQNGDLHETVVLPINKPFQFTFSINAKNDVNKIEAFIKNNNVLAASTTNDPQNNLRLFEIQPNVYQGLLKTEDIPGKYGLDIQVFDNKGNITEQQLFALKVIPPLMVFSQETKEPIEHAQITLSRLDIRTNKYVLVTSKMFAIQNPSFTDIQGQISYVLPQGGYQMNINALGYADKTVTFRIGSGSNEQYPTIYLEKAGISLGSIGHTVGALFMECVSATDTYFSFIGNSKQFSFVASSLTIILFVILSLLALRFRLGINLFLLPWLFGYRLWKLLFKQKNVACGRVIEEEYHVSIMHAAVTIIDADRNVILHKTKTNPTGEFFFTPTDCALYKIAVEKNGYDQHPFFEFTKESLLSGILVLPMKQENQAVSIGMYISESMKELLSLSLEIVLITSCALEIIFGIYLGWIFVLPFLVISLLNFIILLLNMHDLKS